MEFINEKDTLDRISKIDLANKELLVYMNSFAYNELCKEKGFCDWQKLPIKNIDKYPVSVLLQKQQVKFIIIG